MAPADETTTQNHAKRKASIAGFPNGVRPVKRRAAKACQTCRSRKVRCDVVENGPPCNNCRLDQLQCIVSESRRKRQPRVNGEDGQSPISSTTKTEAGDPQSSSISAKTHDQSSPSASVGGPSLDVSAGKSFEFELDHHVPHMLYRTQGHRLSHEERNRRMSMSSGLSACCGALGQESSSISGRRPPAQPCGSTTPLPPYIRPLPPTILAEDLEYLRIKGSLLIPVSSIRNAILRSYVEFVHPFMPILDLEGFLGAIADGDGSRDKISLLLVQAVLFAGSAFVDMRHLFAAGFSDREAARKAFFHRTKLLYDFGCELDRVSLVQSLLLMTSFYETPYEHKGMSHWMAITLSLAQASGLHRDPGSSKMDPKKQSLSKRIWWTCYMRESVIALGMRQPTRIKDEDFDVPMLALEDFDIQALSSKICEMLGPCLWVSDTPQMRKLAAMCIQKAKLCACMGNVLSTHYSFHSHRVCPTADSTMTLLPKNPEAWRRQIQHCEEAVKDWYMQLPPNAFYKTQDLTTWQRTSEVIKVHQALLNMLFFALCSTLHSSQLQVSSFADDCTVSKLQENSRKKVCSAAYEITKIIHDINETDLTKYLPANGVTVWLSAMVRHLLDPKCDDEAQRKTRAQCHQQCMEVLQRIRDAYGSADLATSLLETAIHMANLPIISDFKLERQKEALLAALTPPPESCTSKSSSRSPWTSGRLRHLEEESPPTSEAVDEYACSGRAALPEEVKGNPTSCDTDLDTDFDALFDLDADVDLSAAATDASQILRWGTSTHGLHPDVERTRCDARGGSHEQPGFSQQRLYGDPIANMRIPIQV